MHKFIFIAVLLVTSCTVKKQQEPVPYEATEDAEEHSGSRKKKYIYTDTAPTVAPALYDTAAAVVVEAPAEESYEEAAQDTIEVDTAVYRWQLAVSPDSVKKWKEMKSFAWVKNIDSLLKAAKEKNNQQQKTRRSRSSGGSWLDSILSSGALQALLWILAGAFVLFIIYQLFVTNGTFKRTAKTAIQTAEAEEEIITPESDFDRLIREAVQQRNYRLAIRYHYLQTLHALAQKKYIQLAADKTNYSYVREIADYEKQNSFAGLTLNYEYVWYGEFAIDELVYSRLKTDFYSFNTKI